MPRRMGVTATAPKRSRRARCSSTTRKSTTRRASKPEGPVRCDRAFFSCVFLELDPERRGPAELLEHLALDLADALAADAELLADLAQRALLAVAVEPE